MQHYKPWSVILKLLSNHDSRFLTHGLGLVRLFFTIMKHESNLSSCYGVPNNKNSVLSSLISNRSWIIHFLTCQCIFLWLARPHKLHNFYYHRAKIKAVCLSGLHSISLSCAFEWFETQIQLRIIRETITYMPNTLTKWDSRYVIIDINCHKVSCSSCIEKPLLFCLGLGLGDTLWCLSRRIMNLIMSQYWTTLNNEHQDSVPRFYTAWTHIFNN